MKSNNPLKELLTISLYALLSKETYWFARVIALFPFTFLLVAYLIIFLGDRPEIRSAVIGATVTILTAPSLLLILSLIAMGSLLTIVFYKSCVR